VGALFVRPAIVGVAIGGLLFVALRIGVVRWPLVRHQRQGLNLARAGDLQGAIHAFDRSEAFWLRHPWLDERRWLLGTSARWSFLQMARTNRATCRASLGQTDTALAELATILAVDPDLGPARLLHDNLLRGPIAASPPPGDWSAVEAL
jgi:hypothetical protein